MAASQVLQTKQKVAVEAGSSTWYVEVSNKIITGLLHVEDPLQSVHRGVLQPCSRVLFRHSHLNRVFLNHHIHGFYFFHQRARAVSAERQLPADTLALRAVVTH